MTTRHEIVNPSSLAPPVGFAHAVVAAPGRTVYLGGQAGHDSSGKLTGATIPQQFDVAAANVIEALSAAGGRPDDLVSIQIFVTDAAEYRSSTRELRDVYRKHFGDHYPAVTLFEVTSLFDPAAKVELVCVAVIPDDVQR